MYFKGALLAAVTGVIAIATACSPQSNSGTKSSAAAGSDKKPTTTNVLASTETAAMPGPFGIAMGEDVAKLNATPLKEKPTYYEISSPPRSNSDFAEVIVQAAPGIGVCFIKGIGNTFPSDDFGMAVRQRTDALEAQLETKYGKPELVDRIAPGSLWTEPREWMMGLRHGDRYYAYHWKLDDKGAQNGITEIYAAAKAINTYGEEVRVDLEYYSNKSADCDQAAKKAAASSL